MLSPPNTKCSCNIQRDLSECGMGGWKWLRQPCDLPNFSIICFSTSLSINLHFCESAVMLGCILCWLPVRPCPFLTLSPHHNLTEGRTFRICVKYSDVSCWSSFSSSKHIPVHCERRWTSHWHELQQMLTCLSAYGLDP